MIKMLRKMWDDDRGYIERGRGHVLTVAIMALLISPLIKECPGEKVAILIVGVAVIAITLTFEVSMRYWQDQYDELRDQYDKLKYREAKNKHYESKYENNRI